MEDTITVLLPGVQKMQSDEYDCKEYQQMGQGSYYGRDPINVHVVGTDSAARRVSRDALEADTQWKHLAMEQQLVWLRRRRWLFRW